MKDIKISVNVDNYLAVNKYDPDEESHIVLADDIDCAENVEVELCLLEAASDALVSLQEWDARLEGALSSSISLAEFLRLAEDMIPYSFGFYDSNIAVLGASSNFNEWAEEVAGEEGRASDAPNGTLPNSILSDLFEDEEYQEAPQHKEPLYYTNTLNDLTTLNSYCVNLFSDGVFAARFVVNVPLGEQRFPSGAERVIEHFADKLTEFFIRFTGSDAMFGNFHDSVHNLFRGEEVEPYKPIESPSDVEFWMSPFVHHDYVVDADGNKIGTSFGRQNACYFSHMISIGCIDPAFAEEGTEVYVLWGNPGQRQKKIRAKIARYPYNNVMRSDATDMSKR